MPTTQLPQPHESLIAWQRAHELFLETHHLTRGWPLEEKYGMVSQARRAAFSVPANIVEGNAKRGRGELHRFLDIAVGSLAELRYAMRAASDLGYVQAAQLDRFHSLADETGRCLFGLLKAVDRARPAR